MERLEKETAVYELLKQLEIPYEAIDHPAAMTIADCEEIDKKLGIQICKNLFLCNRQKTQFYLLMLPGEKPFKTKFLSSQIGSARLSFADAEHMEEYLNITPLLKMYINIYAYISTLTVRCKHSFLISIRPKNLFKIFCLSHKNHKMNAKNCIFPIKSGL